MKGLTLKRSADWIPFLIVLAISPLFLFPSREKNWIFLVFFAMALILKVIKGKIFGPTPLDLAILMLLIQILISSFVVSDIELSLPKIAGAIFGILFFYFSLDVLKNESIIKTGLIILLCGGALFSVLCLLGMIIIPAEIKYFKGLVDLHKSLPKINFHLPGAESGFDPNPVGGTLVLFMPLCFSFLYSYIKKKNGESLPGGKAVVYIILVPTILISSFVLLLTQSRGSWLALISSLMLFLIIESRKRKGKMLVVLLIVALCVMVGFYIQLIGYNNINSAKNELISKFYGRLQAWQVGMKIIQEHPLTGIGMNYVRMQEGIGYSRAHAHNHYIHTAAELGIPALIAYLAMTIISLVMCFHVARITDSFWIKAAVRGLAMGQVAYSIFGIGDSIPLGAKVGIFFWISLALIVALFKLSLTRQSLDERKSLLSFEMERK